MARTPRKPPAPLPQIGWREWIHLADLGAVSVKAKIDTGAKTSAIHAWKILEKEVGDQLFVTFDLHPHQRTKRGAVSCSALVIDRRLVRNSGGTQQARYVIVTPAKIGAHILNIELGLTQRDEMGFRMLLGREAFRGRFLVDAAGSFYSGIPYRPSKTGDPQ